MFLEERYEKIIEALKKDGRVTVKKLSADFNVTEDCIRKDLKSLENKNLLKRVYGGAILCKHHIDVKPVDERKNINLSEKKQIAANAFSLIENNDVIFLDITTTNLEIAKLIDASSLKVTIITNMIEIVSMLKESVNTKVICIGGEFNKEAGGIVGSAANNYIENFTFDKSFIGACGINNETGYISIINFEDGNTKHTVINNSNENYIVMESSKYNYDEFYKFASLSEVTAVITEKDITYTE